ncbi:hypothetical protein F5984_20020 [Rudanella paleaurantiibacter]|uniref:Uncharacterized protein n=1 Tax=Rudanella paleaurantiibacter TaxID=2614655 RepID=A0A7J5TVT1_9BACT|nr:hypothetical protein [Rudanella paleaurantiibacter]KAB7728043.1 hypothetical protein F5984_20020 [Rudanella paleaurantiibacter]
MSTFGELYRKARSMRDERQAIVMQQKLADPVLIREIDELGKIMSQTLDVFLKHGGSKATEDTPSGQ